MRNRLFPQPEQVTPSITLNIDLSSWAEIIEGEKRFIYKFKTFRMKHLNNGNLLIVFTKGDKSRGHIINSSSTIVHIFLEKENKEYQTLMGNN